MTMRQENTDVSCALLRRPCDCAPFLRRQQIISQLLFLLVESELDILYRKTPIVHDTKRHFCGDYIYSKKKCMAIMVSELALQDVSSCLAT